MASPEGQTIHRVLLVDDDDALLEVMRALLELNGFEVVAVGGVTEALKRIATESFQVLITDLHMPNAGDGFTVISAMSSVPWRRSFLRRTKSWSNLSNSSSLQNSSEKDC